MKQWNINTQNQQYINSVKIAIRKDVRLRS